MRATAAEIAGARAFLRVVGADTRNPALVRAVVAWFRCESGSVSRVVGNNPFNIRPGVASKYANGTRRGRVGVFLTFRTLPRGFMAAGVVLKALAPSYGYGTVLRRLREGNAEGFLFALARSSWDAGHYGLPASNRLREVYRMIS
jgi:hypothetical protein